MPMTDYEKMKTAELRKMVREHRKTSATPLGKMSKVALMLELDKFAGTPSTMPSHAPVQAGAGRSAVTPFGLLQGCAICLHDILQSCLLRGSLTLTLA